MSDQPVAKVIEGLFTATMELASARGLLHDQPDIAGQRLEAAIRTIDEAMVLLRRGAACGNASPAPAPATSAYRNRRG